MEKNAEKTALPHDIILESRTRLSVTGVQKILHCSPESAAIQTGEGTLNLTGVQINVETLDLDTGQAKLTGRFDVLEYTQAPTAGGLLQRLLR